MKPYLNQNFHIQKRPETEREKQRWFKLSSGRETTEHFQRVHVKARGKGRWRVWNQHMQGGIISDDERLSFNQGTEVVAPVLERTRPAELSVHINPSPPCEGADVHRNWCFSKLKDDYSFCTCLILHTSFILLPSSITYHTIGLFTASLSEGDQACS